MTKKFEYMKFNIFAQDAKQGEGDILDLNYLGDQGWELITIQINGMAYLMRSIGDEPAMQAEPIIKKAVRRSVDSDFFAGKANDTLIRELRVMRTLNGVETIRLAALVTELQREEPDFAYANVVTLLNRLTEVQALERPFKGTYRAGPLASQYMVLLVNHIQERGIDLT